MTPLTASCKSIERLQLFYVLNGIQQLVNKPISKLKLQQLPLYPLKRPLLPSMRVEASRLYQPSSLQRYQPPQTLTHPLQQRGKQMKVISGLTQMPPSLKSLIIMRSPVMRLHLHPPSLMHPRRCRLVLLQISSILSAGVSLEGSKEIKP
jgi:hypothetical protein